MQICSISNLKRCCSTKSFAFANAGLIETLAWPGLLSQTTALQKKIIATAQVTLT